MQATVQQFLEGIGNETTRRAMGLALGPMADALSSQALGSAGLAITGVGSTTASVVTAIDAVAGGVHVHVGAAALPALVGTVTNGLFGIYAFDVDAGGTIHTTLGIPGATLATAQEPVKVNGRARIGYVRVNPTGTGNFVGGTTHLDDATVVPNAVYVNITGAYNPTILAGFSDF